MSDYCVEFTMPYARRYKDVYQLRISLDHTDPEVWRRIQVPGSYTFYDLHVAIQDAMGWLDYHLFEFNEKQAGFRANYRIVSVFDEPEEMSFDVGWDYATEVPIKKLFKAEQDTVLYRYDFGDNWEHSVTLEKILPREKGIKYPICVDGALAGPPEDCGSIPGYYKCVAAVKDKNNEMLQRWVGDWKPESFSPKDVKFETPLKRMEIALDE